MSKIVMLLGFLYSSANAQWIVQQVSNINGLEDIYFADTSKGWVTALNDGIFYTGDGGYTWQQQYTSFAGNLSGLSDTELWIVGDRDTLLHTTNGGIGWDKISLKNYTDLDTVLSLTGIYFLNNRVGWVYVFGKKSGMEKARLLKTTNYGVNWQMKLNPITSSNALIQFLDTSIGFIGGTDPVPLCKTTNGGENWDTLTYLGWYSGLMDMQFIDQNFGWATSDGPVLTTVVWKTIDGGLNWENNILFQCSDLSTYIFFTDTLNGWVVQWTCLSSATEIYHTTNGGLSWDLQYTYSPFSRPKKIYFVDELHGWVISNYWSQGTILHTSTGGMIPVELSSFTAEFIDNTVNLKWITATETNNRGFELEKKSVNSNTPAQKWKKIGFLPGKGTTTEPTSYLFKDKDIKSGTYKYRLKQIDLDGTITYSNEQEIKIKFSPKELTLEQNYPNPFNSSTLIKYHIPESSNIRVTIFNILGKEIKVLVNEKEETGDYELKFDANNFPSGVYICRLETRNTMKIQFKINKMVLIK